MRARVYEGGRRRGRRGEGREIGERGEDRKKEDIRRGRTDEKERKIKIERREEKRGERKRNIQYLIYKCFYCSQTEMFEKIAAKMRILAFSLKKCL